MVSSSAKLFFRPGVCVVMAIVPMVASCQYDPYTLSYATTEPDRRDIVGVWTPTDSTLKELSHTAYSTAHPRIEVRADGVIHITDIPDTWQAPFGEGSGKVENFVGDWKLSKHQDSWWGLALSSDKWECDGCLMIIGNKPPHKLVVRFGDPDSGFGYEFKKVG